MRKNKALQSVADAVQFIEANLRGDLNVGRVCARYEMSPWEFQRAFRAFTLDSIGNYIRARRLTVAAELLERDASVKVIDVAFEVGFGSPEVFTRAFKEHFGIPPLQWRKGIRESGNIKRVPISELKLSRLAQGIRGPEIVKLPAARYVGITTEIQSPFGREADFDRRVPNLWLEFNPRRKEILHRETGKGYGIAVDFKCEGDTEWLTYLASARVSGPGELPPGMREVSVPEGTYAAFESRGTLESSHAIYDHIFGVWLPGSEFRRADEGYEIEAFDRRFSMSSAEALSVFYVPIE